jgi:hypothetical protein
LHNDFSRTTPAFANSISGKGQKERIRPQDPDRILSIGEHRGIVNAASETTLENAYHRFSREVASFAGGCAFVKHSRRLIGTPEIEKETLDSQNLQVYLPPHP